MKTYFKVDSNNIVNEIISTIYDVGSDYIECNCKGLAIGKRWNGSTFEEVPVEEVEVPETTEVTNEDLLEILLAIGEKVGA